MGMWRTGAFLFSPHADAQELSGMPPWPPDRARLSTGGPCLLSGSLAFRLMGALTLQYDERLSLVLEDLEPAHDSSSIDIEQLSVM